MIDSLVVRRWSDFISLKAVDSVTRFGEILPLWQNFTSLWQNCDIIGLMFIVSNGQILKNNLSGHTGSEQELTDFHTTYLPTRLHSIDSSAGWKLV